MRTVNKPWGKEEIWAETPKYVGKYLYIDRGHRLSRQYHVKKEETIRVISGTLILEVGVGPEHVLNLEPGDVYHVTPLTVHRFGAGVHDDVVLVEVSTPELDDVIRLQDDYSR
jgi:mannose-6-phosphate isomerase-like protein (cupin superfamily)